MKNIFRFLSRAKGAVLVIVLLLIFQAYCDLALPTYTSDLLNVGLQRGGVEDAVPDTVRDESLGTLELFLTDSDTETVEAAYSAPDAGGVRALRADADRETVDQLLLLPESVVLQLSATDEGAAMLDQLKAAVEMGALSKDDVQARLKEQLSQMEDLTDMYLAQVAAGWVAAEYRAQGVDLNAVRNAYLFKVGGKMLLMALLMAVIAIAVGYIAARVSAGIGRDLREQLYARVMSFTSAEIERFSTASLITRCTNDIQQVQMLCVMLLRMVAYAPILAVAGVFHVIRTGSQMSWIIVAAVIALAVCIAILFVAAYPKFRIMQDLVDRLNLVSRELLTGIMPIRAFERQKHEEQRFDRANTDLMRTQLFTQRIMTFMSPVMMLIMNGVSVLIVWVGGHGVDQGVIQVGDLTAFITYSMVIIMGSPSCCPGPGWRRTASRRCWTPRSPSSTPPGPETESWGIWGASSPSTTCPSPIPARTRRCWSTSPSPPNRGRPLPSSAPPAAASPPWST